MAYNSKYTGEQVEKRLDQNYYDDVLKAGVDGQIITQGEADKLDKPEFDNKLALSMFRDVASRKNIGTWSTSTTPHADEIGNISDISDYLTDEIIMSDLYPLEDYHYIVSINQEGHFNYYYIDISKANLPDKVPNKYFKIYKPINFDSTDISILNQDVVELWIVVEKDTLDASPVIKKEFRIAPVRNYMMTQGRVRLGRKPLVSKPGNQTPYDYIQKISDSYTDEELKDLIAFVDESPADAFIIEYQDGSKVDEFYIDKQKAILSGEKRTGIRIYSPMGIQGNRYSSDDESLYELLVVRKTVSGSSSVDILRSIKFVPMGLRAGERYDASFEITMAAIDLSISGFKSMSAQDRLLAIKERFRGKSFKFLADLTKDGVNLVKFYVEDVGLEFCYFLDSKLWRNVFANISICSFAVYDPFDPLLVLNVELDMSGYISETNTKDLSARVVIDSAIHYNFGISSTLTSGEVGDDPTAFLVVLEAVMNCPELNAHLTGVLDYIEKLDVNRDSYIIRFDGGQGAKLDFYADYATRHYSNRDLNSLTIYSPLLGPESVALVAQFDKDTTLSNPETHVRASLIKNPFSTEYEDESISGQVEMDLSALPSYKRYNIADGTSIIIVNDYPGYKKETIIEFGSSGNASFTIDWDNNFSITAGESIIVRFTWLDPHTLLLEKVYGSILSYVPA